MSRPPCLDVLVSSYPVAAFPMVRRLRYQIHFLLLVSRQGKIRLTKYYSRYPASEKTRMLREVATMVLNRSAKMCNFLEWKDKKIIYKRCVAVVARTRAPSPALTPQSRPCARQVREPVLRGVC